MQYHLKWIPHHDRNMVFDLAARVYNTPKPSYPSLLNPDTKHHNPLHYFLVPDRVSNHQSRKILGVFSPDSKIPVMVVAVRTIDYTPSWMISWTISSLKNAAFCRAWQQSMNHLTDFFENTGLNEFYVVSPVSREAIYSRLMQPLRHRYWTFVETMVPSNQKSQYGLHWLIMGQQLYPYDINLRRYVLRRPPS
jgi:hypothetical protein